LLVRRRQFLRLAAGVTGGYAIGVLAPPAGASQLTGGGGVTKTRGSLRLGSHTVAPGQTLRFDPNHDTTMELTGNLVVEGTLEMKPNPGVQHTLRFVGIDESRFVGGGMDVLDSDVGLWVMGRGRLDIEGLNRVGWNRTGTDDTWKKTDEILTTPFAPGDTTTFAPYQGRLNTAKAPDGRVFRQEAFNLTRSVRIEGTPQGRAHIFIHSTAPQNVRYAALRHMGPRTPVGGQEISTSVLGRYGLHFHMCDNGSRGSEVTGVVVRDCGGHAFVPHNSHGVTFRDCIAFNVNQDAFWWDRGTGMATNDTLYDHCLAAGLVPIPSFRGYTLSGFNLPDGKNNAVLDSVVAGNRGNKTASGFQWQSGTKGTWLFRDCIAHNNHADGIFVWQNNGNKHLIQDFVGFRNSVGIQHGAYSNAYMYERCLTFENGSGLLINAVSAREPRGQLSWENCVFSDGVAVGSHAKSDAGQPALIVDSLCTSVVVDEEGHKDGAGAYDFIRCDLDPTDWAVLTMFPDSRYRVQNSGGSAYQVNPDGTTTSIPAFA
jgi:hypothetical protein